uniref:Uncharacterized protein n=1 Tax=Arion vulgaris TaxID=1028688 RepID=A0A0B7AUJ8_9EUPU
MEIQQFYLKYITIALMEEEWCTLSQIQEITSSTNVTRLLHGSLRLHVVR